MTSLILWLLLLVKNGTATGIYDSFDNDLSTIVAISVIQCSFIQRQA